MVQSHKITETNLLAWSQKHKCLLRAGIPVQSPQLECGLSSQPQGLGKVFISYNFTVSVKGSWWAQVRTLQFEILWLAQLERQGSLTAGQLALESDRSLPPAPWRSKQRRAHFQGAEMVFLPSSENLFFFFLTVLSVCCIWQCTFVHIF